MEKIASCGFSVLVLTIRLRGGDIDLLVRPDSSGGYALMDKIRILGKLERGLEEHKIDIVIETPDDQRPIVKIAHERHPVVNSSDEGAFFN